MTKKKKMVPKLDKEGIPMLDAEGKPIMVEEPEKEENGEKDDDTEDENGDDDARKVLDAWLAEQDEAVQTMFKDATAGLLSALKKERTAAKDAVAAAKKVVELEKKLDAYKTDEEKELEARETKVGELTKSLASAEATATKAVEDLKVARIGFAVTKEALMMGFADPDDAQALLPEDSGVKYNKKTDEVEGVEEALKTLVEAKPYLLGAGDGVGTPRSDGRTKKLSADEKKAPVTVKI